MLNISKKKIWSVFAVVHHCFLLTYKRHGHLRAVIFCIFQTVTVGTFLNTEWSSTSVLDRQLWNCVFRILFTNYNYLLCILLEMFNYIITIQLLYPHKQLFLFFLLANNFLETVLSSFKIHCCNLSLIKEDLEWFKPLHLEVFPIGVIEILSGLIFFFCLLLFFFFSSPFWNADKFVPCLSLLQDTIPSYCKNSCFFFLTRFLILSPAQWNVLFFTSAMLLLFS